MQFWVRLRSEQYVRSNCKWIVERLDWDAQALCNSHNYKLFWYYILIWPFTLFCILNLKYFEGNRFGSHWFVSFLLEILGCRYYNAFFVWPYDVYNSLSKIGPYHQSNHQAVPIWSRELGYSFLFKILVQHK